MNLVNCGSHMYFIYLLLGVTNGNMSDADEDARLDHAIVPYPDCESFHKVQIALFLSYSRSSCCMQDTVKS